MKLVNEKEIAVETSFLLADEMCFRQQSRLNFMAKVHVSL